MFWWLHHCIIAWCGNVLVNQVKMIVSLVIEADDQHHWWLRSIWSHHPQPGVPAPECGRVLNNKVSPELKQVESLFMVLLFLLLTHIDLIPPSNHPQALLDIHNDLRARVARGEEGAQVKPFENLSHSLTLVTPPPPSCSQGHRTCSNLCGTMNWRELLKLGPTSVIVSSKKARSSLDTTNRGNQRFKKHKSANVKRYAHNVLVLSPSSP